MIEPSTDIGATVRLRPAVAEDAPFILESWVRSYRDKRTGGSPHAIPADVYWPEQKALVRRLLSRSNVLVAASAEETRQILGYAIVEPLPVNRALHYVYVKEPFRGFGVAQLMLDALQLRGAFITHRTRRAERLVEALGLVFNPYLAGAP